MPAGRPTKYTEEMPNRVEEYLAEVGTMANRFPTVQGLSLYLEVDTDTVVEWAKEYPEFSVALKKLMSLQAVQLMNDGVYAQTNSTIVKLILMNNHGMKERNDQTTNDKDLPTPIYGGDSKGNF